MLHPKSIMEPIHQIIRSNYAVLAEAIQTEIQFLIDLAELTEDQRFKQSIAEVIYSLSDLFDTIDLQRRYLRSGMCNFSEPPNPVS